MQFLIPRLLGFDEHFAGKDASADDMQPIAHIC
jgi:hypothetical protein